MKTLPTLQTSRLILRPFELTDAPEVQKLAGAREIASTIAYYRSSDPAILILEKNGDLVLYKYRELRLIRNNVGLNHEIIEVSGDKI